jgi:hypothetical protein
MMINDNDDDDEEVDGNVYYDGSVQHSKHISSEK